METASTDRGILGASSGDARTYDPKRATGFRFDQLAAAFDRIRDPRDWKAAIRAVVPADERLLVEAAVRWFTGTEACFEPAVGSPGRLVVTAAGYREGHAERPQETH